MRDLACWLAWLLLKNEGASVNVSGIVLCLEVAELLSSTILDTCCVLMLFRD
jgi:hypothetical protein